MLRENFGLARGLLGGHCGDSRFIVEDLGNVAGLCDVTVQSDCPRNVVKVEQIVDAPSDDDIRTVVESARDEALI